jgi:hypothetical protein
MSSGVRSTQSGSAGMESGSSSIRRVVYWSAQRRVLIANEFGDPAQGI